MVKGFDPSKDDYTGQLLDYFMGWMRGPPALELSSSAQLVKKWLSSSERTSNLYTKMKQKGIKPQIVVKKNCKLPYLTFMKIKQPFQEHFPAYIQENRIIICINYLKNTMEIKENLDRELTLFNQIHTHPPQIDEKTEMSMIYKSCYAGYRNYLGQPEMTKRLTDHCARRLFYLRSKSDLPPDRLYRLATKLIDQVKND